MGMNDSYLCKREVQRLLGVNAFGLRRVVRKYDDLPEPTERPRNPFAVPGEQKEGEEAWEANAVYRWAAATPEFSHRGALLERPLPADPFPGHWAGHAETVRGSALDWDTALGLVRIVHNDDRNTATIVACALVGSGNPDAVVTVCALSGDVTSTGPVLVACDTAHPTIEYDVPWGVVAALAGEVLPWWPKSLRLPQLIGVWQSGDASAVVEVPANANERILRRAADNTSLDPASRAAATDMANDIRNGRIVKLLAEIGLRLEDWREESNQVVIAAVPDTTHHPLPSSGDQSALRAGWRKLALSTAPDAVAALEIAVGCRPALLPYGALTEVPVIPGTVIERWTQRLAICEPTAAHAVLAEGDAAEEFFTDPLTDMPALRTTGGGRRAVWRFYAPLSLPAGGAVLDSAVLHYTVWITTSDGHVHPAPCIPTSHLWWGGWGDQPSEAAAVIDALLDNLGATVSLRKHWQAPKGLTALFGQEHKHGTQLSRSALLYARMTPPGR